MIEDQKNLADDNAEKVSGGDIEVLTAPVVVHATDDDLDLGTLPYSVSVDDGIGVDLNVYSEYIGSVKVDGNVSSNSGTGVNMALEVDAGAVVTVTGEVSSSGSDAVYINTGFDSSAFLMIGSGVKAGNDGIRIVGEGEAKVKVTGDVSSGSGTGVCIGLNEDAEDDESVMIIRNGKASVTVTGDVISDSGTGVGMDLKGNADADVTVNGDVSSSGLNAVYIETSPFTDAKLTIGGGVRAGWNGSPISEINIFDSPDNTAVYINSDSYDSVELTIGNGVRAGWNGIWIGGECNAAVTVNGDVIAGSSGIIVCSEGEVSITVNGDIKAGGSCIYIPSGVLLDLLVTGTVFGDILNLDVFSELTVWSVYGKVNNIDRIHFIVKMEQPAEGGKVRAVMADDGSRLFRFHDLPTAQNGDTIRFVVYPENGYRVTGATNGTGDKKVPLERIAENTFICQVPPTGGLYLAAILEKITDV